MANNPRHKDNLKNFKKGDPRINRKGAPPKLPKLDVLLDKVMGEEKDGMTAAEAILKALRKKAAAGDVRAAELLMDRSWGKAKQTVEHKGEIATTPMTMNIGMRVHKAEDTKPEQRSKPKRSKKK